ncbi:MAG: hypothetical protein U0840_17330 [Gemmataceae bacterium]
MYPHRMRLRAPWEQHPKAGHVLHRRRFGYPGRIDPHERVWLTLADLAGPVHVHLNDSDLGNFPSDGGELDVTDLLQPRNELILLLPGSTSAPSLKADSPGDIALEVRALAYLQDVHLERTADRIIATGTVVGHADLPLDLYLILDRWTADQTIVPPGSSFRLEGAASTPEGDPVATAKIELVAGAVKWYTVERTLRAEPGPPV